MHEAEPGPSEERDINEAFTDIFLSENRIFEASFKEGVKRGEEEENVEGFHLGYHRGAEVGSEIGYYTGITESYLSYYKENQSPKDGKIINKLESLKKLLDDFPRENNLEVDIFALLNQIRAKFKKICAIIKLRPTFPETNQLSF